MVEDYLGCRAYASVTIGAINPSPIVDLGPDTTACIGDQIVLDAGAGNSYLWSDNSTGQTLTVTTAGTYSVLVTNASGCQAFDAIAVDFISCNAIHSNNTNSVGAANELSIKNGAKPVSRKNDTAGHAIPKTMLTRTSKTSRRF